MESRRAFDARKGQRRELPHVLAEDARGHGIRQAVLDVGDGAVDEVVDEQPVPKSKKKQPKESVILTLKSLKIK